MRENHNGTQDRPSAWALALVSFSLGFAALAFTLLGAQAIWP